MPKERCRLLRPARKWCPPPNTELCSTRSANCQRLLGKKTLENEILREALDLTHPKKRLLRSPLPARDGTP
jgi:hypothetical protein